MLTTSSRNGSICTRCAFRLRLAVLQQQRRPKTGFAKTDPKFAHQLVKKYAVRDRPENTYTSLKGGLVKRYPLAGEDGRGRPGLGQRENFHVILRQRLDTVKDQLREAPVLNQFLEDGEDSGSKREEIFTRLWKPFVRSIARPHEQNAPFLALVGDNDASSELWDDLQSVWRERGVTALDARIKYHFYGFVTNSRFTTSDINNQKALADLRYPSEWFPATRQMQRVIHLHVGPTNSGKTYQALQRLEQAERGVYAGPLRLLAHEVYSRMNAKGKKCALITGEERRLPIGDENVDEANYDTTACTVEMIPLNAEKDVAVIDEIQMIGNSDRGWAWTTALLGVKAKEVHLCGEARTIPLIQQLCASVGERLEIHEYKRLSPLQMSHSSLDGDLRKLRKGDCIVSFSVMGIHALRREIEKSTGRKVAIVYGSLPPETRAQQARLFNDPNNDYDYLVASDAVGMGLNLAIKRIIFETSSKFDGTARRTLSIADIKQIGGRAGRFRTSDQATSAHVSEQELAAAKAEVTPIAEEDEEVSDTPENVGLVTTLERFDFPIVAAAMEAEPEPIQTAGLFPPASVLERFATYFPPGTPFSYILTRLHELSQMHKRFHLCGLKDQIWLADIIESVEGLTVADRNTICSAPASKSDADLWRELLPAYARCIAQQSGGSIIDIQELPLETLEVEATNTKEYLRDLERLHKGIVTYLWLSFRFPGIFSTRALAFHVKTLVEQKIEHVLGQISFSENQRRKLAKAREKKLLHDLYLEQQQQELTVHESQSTSTASSSGATGSSDETTDDADDEEAAAESVMAEFAEEDSSIPKESEEHYQEPEIGAELEGKHSPLPSVDQVDDESGFAVSQSELGGELDVAAENSAAEPTNEKQPDETPPRYEAVEDLPAADRTTQAHDSSFSGEQYLELEEEPEVEKSRDAEVQAEDDEEAKKEKIDAEMIIEELTRHEGDIARKTT